MGIKPKNHGLKFKVYYYETNGRLLIEIDSINWNGTEYWLSV